MRKRTPILLSVVLVALILLVGIVPKVAVPQPSQAIAPNYCYSVKFVCGAGSEEDGVKPANYATEINILNPTEQEGSMEWKVVRLHPGPMKIAGFKFATLKANKGKNIKCAQIYNRLNMAPGTFVTGYVVIRSYSNLLDVAAVYTMLDLSTVGGCGIDVEYIQVKEILPP